MGWLWSVRSIKSRVSFAKETYKRDYILQKRPIIWSIVLTVATPYLSLDCIRIACSECERGRESTGWRRPIGCLVIAGHFPQKSPIISGSVAKNDLQLKASMGLRHPVPLSWLHTYCMQWMWERDNTLQHTATHCQHTAGVPLSWLHTYCRQWMCNTSKETYNLIDPTKHSHPIRIACSEWAIRQKPALSHIWLTFDVLLIHCVQYVWGGYG